MKYYAYLSGPDGCDYTVGCNIKLQKLNATTMIEAEAEVKEIYRTLNPEYDINNVGIFEVHDYVSIDVSAINAEIELSEKEKEAAEQLARDRAKYEELKKKFKE